MGDENPYAAPQSQPGNEMDFRVIGSPRAVVLAWEKLRLKYNVILLIPGLIVLAIYISQQELAVIGSIFGGGLMAAGANLGYFLGPISELYLCAFSNKAELPVYRKYAFWAGVVGSLGLFVLIAIPGLLFS
ncbi:hypothetical protein NT6N_01690 [Oceaniferula spumae]|uniref:Preprotein translocase subunit TatC n=1 Tax=Oceaniferula spumae TaxID=2979115 RepID=A0AAT9FGM8_9BACT